MNRFPGLWPLAFCLSFLVGGGAARAELASSGFDPSGNGIYLLYAEGGRVFRMECDRMSSLRDHAHCKNHPASAPAKSFFALLPTKFATALPSLESEAQEAWIKIQQIDARLFQLVNTQIPQGDDPVTDAQIRAATDAVEKAAMACAELSDQIGRLEADLLQNHGDQGDSDQLAADRARLLQEKAALGAAEARLLALRQTYVAQRSAVSGTDLHDLEAMHAQEVSNYRNARAAIDFELKDLECAAVLGARIQETGFVWESLCSLSSSSDRWGASAEARIGQAFAETERADRTFSAAIVGVRGLTLDVPREGLVTALQCHYPQAAANSHFLGELAIRGPNDLLVEVSLNTSGASIDVGWGEGFIGSPDSDLAAAHLERKDGKGRWTFEFIPHFIGGADGSATQPLVCSVTLQNPLDP